MLLQTLTTMAILVLLAGGLLTSALVSAKTALHESTTRRVQIALARGTDDFTRWAADYVYKNHADAAWPAGTQTLAPQPVCPSVQGPGYQTQASCALYETTAYRVTGSTAAPVGKGAAGAAADTAENLQTVVNEQRISAEVTATITSADGSVLGTGTRELTVRVFDVPPWAVVTGTRDLSSVLGSVHAAEGDTGGVLKNPNGLDTVGAPDPQNPAAYIDTALRVTMTCVNSSANDNQANPGVDNNPPGNNNMPWGVQAGNRAFEAPCQPPYALDSNHQAPAGAPVPTDGNYSIGGFASPKPWSNGSSTSNNSWTQ